VGLPTRSERHEFRAGVSYTLGELQCGLPTQEAPVLGEVIVIHRYVHHNGYIVPIEEARLSPGQVGLFCGWGLFTTMRIAHGEPFAFERHWRRLERDATRTRVPFLFDPAQVRSQLRELIVANDVREGAARIYMIYNQVGFWQSGEALPLVDLLLYTSELPPHREPTRLSVTEHGRNAAGPLSGVKVTSWLQNVWCLQGAQQLGFDETIMLNERGEVAECTAANIFCVRDGAVATPPLSSGCLEGVTRSILLEFAPGAGVDVREQTLSLADLHSADEVFISSTNRSLVGVGEIAGHKLSAAPGPVTLRLEKAFRNCIEEYVARAAAEVPAKQ
jgi:branched-chain amino acid aminotransferase